MGGEDFGRYGRVEPKIPTFLFWLGASKLEVWEKSIKGEIDLPGIHSPFFAPDPIPTLSTGIKVMTAAAIGVFNDNK
jgi:hippurate hydrolase